jgi:hypothetical protein
MSDALASRIGHARMGSARPRKGCGKKTEVEKTVKGEAAFGILRTRKKIAAEASAETEQVRSD